MVIAELRRSWIDGVPRPERHWWIAGAMVLAHVALVIHGIRTNYVTFDEPGYLQSGLSHWQTGTFDMYRVNPPLPRMLGTVPVLTAEPKTDWSELDYYRRTPAARAEFRMAPDFIAANGARTFELLRIARYSTLFWSLLGAAIVYLWARRRFGIKAAVVALGCWCFEPNILAHAALFTPDIPATTMAVATLCAADRYLAQRSWRRAALLGACFGVALLTKLTLLLLVPIFGVLLGYRLLRARLSWRSVAPQLTGAALLALVFVHGGYGFQGALPRLGQIQFVSPSLAGFKLATPEAKGRLFGNRFQGSWLGRLPLPLPEQMVRGIDVQRRDFDSNLHSYMAGEWRRGGFWSYYLYGLGVKVPLGLLALVVGAGALMLCRRRQLQLSSELSLLLPPVALLAFVSSQTGFSHHLRYVLPIFPFVFIHVSRLAEFLERATPVRATAVGGLAAHAVASSLALAPFSLGYFNALAGGVRGGPEHLLNSNIDWGQDLLELKRYLARHPSAEPLHLAYFGQVPPEIVGIDYRPVPVQPNFCARDSSPWAEGFGPKPGCYALSVNYVYGATFPVHNGQGRRWRIRPGELEYFRELTPTAVLGSSIYIYEISVEQANALRQERCLAPLKAPERRGQQARL